jgi:chaperonin GroES
MAIRPLDDRIVLKILDAEETSAGGILLPDSAKEKPQQGKVTAVGAGMRTKDGKRVKPDVKKGDVVLFGKYAGSDVTVDGDEFKILRESEILAKLNT